jgi:hypothetical protein
MVLKLFLQKKDLSQFQKDQNHLISLRKNKERELILGNLNKGKDKINRKEITTMVEVIDQTNKVAQVEIENPFNRDNRPQQGQGQGQRF